MGLFTRKVSIKVPMVGDPVWWAPKGLGCTVTELDGAVVIFQGGEVVKNKKGRQVPRWTVATNSCNFVWDAGLGMWFVGQGPLPKKVRETVIYPDPVPVSGQVLGSFARTS